MATTLTPKDEAALRAIQRGEITMRKFGSGAWRIAGTGCGVSSASVGRAVRMGWARWPLGPIGHQTCELTEEGARMIAPPLVGRVSHVG